MFLSCGDALFDLFATPETRPGAITLDGHVGGSPLNVALGLSRFGNPTAYLAKNSRDTFGQRIRRFIEKNGIATDMLIETGLNSTLAIVETMADGSARYVFYTQGTADRSMDVAELPGELKPDVRCVHVGSYSTATEPTASALLALVSREAASRFISYDPNIRASIEPDLDRWRAQVDAFGKHAHFVKASDEDIEQLYPGRSFEAFAQDRISAGASLVFVTRGSNGAYGFSAGGRSARAEGVKVDVVDTVGAGDTFQAASLHWLGANECLTREAARGADLDALMRFAITAAAITCSRRGADLPTLADVDARLAAG